MLRMTVLDLFISVILSVTKWRRKNLFPTVLVCFISVILSEMKWRRKNLFRRFYLLTEPIGSSIVGRGWSLVRA